MKKRELKKITPSRITIFKIKNRKGYAAVCFDNLTEGRTAAQAFSRLKHPLRRMGYRLDGSLPRVRRFFR